MFARQSPRPSTRAKRSSPPTRKGLPIVQAADTQARCVPVQVHINPPVQSPSPVHSSSGDWHAYAVPPQPGFEV